MATNTGAVTLERPCHRPALAELREDEGRHRGARIDGAGLERQLHLHARERHRELHEHRDRDRHPGGRRAGRDRERHARSSPCSAGDLDHEEAEVADDHERRTATFTIMVDEHRHGDAAERPRRPTRSRPTARRRRPTRGLRSCSPTRATYTCTLANVTACVHERRDRDRARRRAAARTSRPPTARRSPSIRRRRAPATRRRWRRRHAGDLDHEEPEVADDHDRRHGELHDRGHEHRHLTLTNVSVSDPLAPNCNQTSAEHRGARLDGAGCERDLQLLARERDRELHERRDRDRHRLERPDGHRDRHGAGHGHAPPTHAADAAEAAGRRRRRRRSRRSRSSRTRSRRRSPRAARRRSRSRSRTPAT